jgi:hypothetical protein
VDEWSSSCPGRFNPRKEPGHLLNRRLRGPQNWPRRRGEVNKILPLPGIEPRFLGRSAYSVVNTGIQTAPPHCELRFVQLHVAVFQRFNQLGIGRSIEMTSRYHKFYVNLNIAVRVDITYGPCSLNIVELCKLFGRPSVSLNTHS